MAVRQAVGASRTRLVAQLCTESLLLAALGSVLGLLIAQVASRALVTFLTIRTSRSCCRWPRRQRLRLHRAAGAPDVPAVRCGPAVKATSRRPAGDAGRPRHDRIRGEASTSAAAWWWRRSRCRSCCCSARCCSRQTLRNLLRRSGHGARRRAGRQRRRAAARTRPEHRRVMFDQIEERIEAQPGVGVAQVTLSPFGGSGWNGTVHAQGAA